MPDFFRGVTLDRGLIPPKNAEDYQKITDFLETTANVKEKYPDIALVVDALHKDGRTKLSAVGYCWGSKMVTLAGATNAFEAVASIHPSYLTVDDAKDFKVPIALYLSKDESDEE
ncbi:hypothetical protein FRB94_012087, partial [Tulasnella sp. JGI-2019a]